MKRFIYIVILIVFSFLLTSCNVSEEVKNDEIIKTSSENVMKKASSEKLNGDGSVDVRWYYRYYPNGEVSTSTCCLEDGRCKQRNTYTYYEDSNLIKTEIVYLFGEKKSYTEYSYDDNNKLSMKKIYQPESITTTTYYYNADGSENYNETHNGSDELISITKYIYDSAGNKTEECFYDSNNNYVGGIKYTYAGQLPVTKEYIGTASDEFSREEYTYDGENIIKTVLYDINGVRKYTDTAEFDGDKCMQRMRIDSNNSIVYTWNSQYANFVTLIG